MMTAHGDKIMHQIAMAMLLTAILAALFVAALVIRACLERRADEREFSPADWSPAPVDGADTATTDPGLPADEQVYAADMAAVAAQARADADSDTPAGLTGEPTEQEREAVVTAIQEQTTEVAILDPEILAARQTQAEFDDAFRGIVEEFDDEFAIVVAALTDDEDVTRAILNAAYANRALGAPTVEMPTLAGAVAS